MGENGVNINFGGKNTWALNKDQKGINKEAFQASTDGVQKEKEKQKIIKQNEINEKIFNYFDKNKDGVLDTGELTNLQDTMAKLANARSKGDNTVDSNEAELLFKMVANSTDGIKGANRSNLLSFLNTLNNTEGKDNVASATTDATGVTTLDLGGGNYDKYKMEDVDGTPTKVILEKANVDPKTGLKTITKYEGGKLAATIIEDPANLKTTEYDAQNRPTKITVGNSGGTTEFFYDKTPPQAKVHIGNMNGVYMLGDDNKPDYDKPLSVKRFDNTVCTEVEDTYEWNSDNTVTVTNGADKSKTTYGLTQDGVIDEDHPQKTVTQDGPNTVTIDYSYEGGVVKRTKTVTNAAGEKVAEPVEVDEKGEPVNKDETYEVKAGETWYNIAAQRYGLTKHSDIMEAVHVLKDQYDTTKGPAGYNKAIGPQTVDGGKLNLPATITVGGKTVHLGGKVDETPAAAPKAAVEEAVEEETVTDETPVSPTATFDAPEPVAVPSGKSTITPLKNMEVPIKLGVEFDMSTWRSRISIPQDGQSEEFQGEGGMITKVSREGNVVHKEEGFGNNLTRADIQLDETGTKVVKTTVYEPETPNRADIYDETGTLTQSIITGDDGSYTYDKSGALVEFTRNGKYQGNDAVFTYNAEGKPTKIVVTITENGEDKQVTYIADSEHEGKFKTA